MYLSKENVVSTHSKYVTVNIRDIKLHVLYRYCIYGESDAIVIMTAFIMVTTQKTAKLSLY